jgi:TonB family protein
MNVDAANFRGNLTVVMIVHIAAVASLFLWEMVVAPRRNNEVITMVDLVIPGDILGELPKGSGYGRGVYTPPLQQQDLLETRLAAPSLPQNLPDGESVVPHAVPKPVVTPASVIRPGDVTIPAKTTAKPPAAKPNTTATAAAKKPAATAMTKAKPPSGTSAQEYRDRFARALIESGGSGGTARGDNRPAGGGTGIGPLGSPDGVADGMIGGRGKGSPFWSYFIHVHDRMYEAWELPSDAASWDRRLMTTVKIRVARSGDVLSVGLATSSGNRSMDDSVMAAARSVSRFNPLPEGLGDAHVDITVNFRPNRSGDT